MRGQILAKFILSQTKELLKIIILSANYEIENLAGDSGLMGTATL